MLKQEDKLGALWRRTSKNGDEYFSGDIGGVRVVIFSNSHKNSEKHPDFIVYRSLPRE